MGFEPMNIGFANQRLSPLGYAAENSQNLRPENENANYRRKSDDIKHKAGKKLNFHHDKT